MHSSHEIRIARLIARLNVGGPAMQAILMTAAFREKGYPALLLSGQLAEGEDSMDYLAEARKVEVVHVPGMSRRISPSADLRALATIVREFYRFRPTVLHTHTAKAGTLGRLAAILLRVPVRVHTFHGHVFRGYFPPWTTRIFLAIERLLARHTDCIVALSDSQKKELSELYCVAPAEKIRIVPLGLNLEPYLRQNKRGSLRSECNIPASSPVVGWVGRLTAIKSPERLLRSVDPVSREFPDVRFVVAGDGELRGQCERDIQRSQLNDRVQLLGWRRDLPQIYSDLDVVVLTSKNEGTPVALLEAMASGRAVVSTDVGGVRDLMVGPSRAIAGVEVFQNGVLVKDDVAGGICHLLSDPRLRESMGQSGRQFVLSRFSQSRLADDLEDLYLSLAQAKGLASYGLRAERPILHS